MASYLRGALVEFLPTGLIPVPNVIVFQYNPETMTHTWTQPDAEKAEPNRCTETPLAVAGDPGESFSFTLFLDAADTIADGAPSAGLAAASGVYTRLAALEMLLFPSAATTGGLLGTVTAKIGSLLGASRSQEQAVPANTLNTVLFVWGVRRIVPVRVTALTVTERLYDSKLNPTHAEAQITLRVLTANELVHDTADLAPLARAANAYSQGLRETLAEANSGNPAAESIVGMLPR
jgi:hypothetical protein